MHTGNLYASVEASLITHGKQEIHDLPSQYWTSTIDCGCPSPHFQIQIQAQGTDALALRPVRVLRWEPNIPDADPYANNLRVDTVCTAAALCNLGIHIGLTEEILCADESLSPFFRFNGELVDNITKSEMIEVVYTGYFQDLEA